MQKHVEYKNLHLDDFWGSMVAVPWSAGAWILGLNLGEFSEGKPPKDPKKYLGTSLKYSAAELGVLPKSEVGKKDAKVHIFGRLR